MTTNAVSCRETCSGVCIVVDGSASAVDVGALNNAGATRCDPSRSGLWLQTLAAKWVISKATSSSAKATRARSSPCSTARAGISGWPATPSGTLQISPWPPSLACSNESLCRYIEHSPGTKATRWPTTSSSPNVAASTCTSRTPTHPGNGLIRRYVGKGTNLAAFTPTDIRAIEHRINTTPRRVLNWATAQHVYHEAVAMTS